MLSNEYQEMRGEVPDKALRTAQENQKEKKFLSNWFKERVQENPMSCVLVFGDMEWGND